ncbi:MAG: putative toxin-antitoxin system toxin component, PIN family [Treponema sp.]|nr:putative toxin-antitoxin system toxin component, PIN family [Treponema sp.]
MVDANIIVSAILFPQSIVAETIKFIVSNHELTLSQYTIDEVKEVFNKKFPHRKKEMKYFIEKLPYKLFSLKEIDNKKYPNIRDIDDLPVLANAIESNIDLLVTGDKDFNEIRIKRPKIMNPRKFLEKYKK